MHPGDPMTVPGRATRAEVEAVFRAAPDVYLYGIGDLADDFWGRAPWWATPRAAIGRLRLDGIPEPIVDAQGFPDDPELLALVASVAEQLPDACAGQVAIGIDRALSPWFDVVESVALRGMVRCAAWCVARHGACPAGSVGG